MKKSFVLLLHFGFWGCYLILIMVMLGMYFQDHETMDEAITNAFKIMFNFALLPAAITFYGFYFLVFPHYLKKKNIYSSISYGVLIAFLAALVGVTGLSQVAGEFCLPEEEEGFSTIIELSLFMTFIAMISGVVALVIKGFITWAEEVKLKEALQQKNHEMEMVLVKSQLDPHFLFNTINNIDVLILKDSNKASTYLNKLSDIMRFMLYETKTDEILLAKEIEYIEKYIELQKIRTSNEKYVDFQILGKPSNKTIAPMLFIPFIENAFKHTSNKKLENAISIKVKIEEDTISFECKNKFDPHRKQQQGNHGLGNELIQKRLDLLYPNAHELEISNQNEAYQVRLTINSISTSKNPILNGKAELHHY